MSALSPPALLPAEDRPDFATFAERLGAGAAKLRSVRELHAWLASPDRAAPLEIRCDRLEAAARWLRTSGAIPQRERVDPAEPMPTRRLRLLVDALAVAPGYAQLFRALVSTVLADSQPLGLFEAGLPNQRGIGAETGDRMSRRFLPSVRSPRDLSALLGRLFPGRKDPDWLASLPADLVERLGAQIDAAPLLAGVIDA